MVKKANSQRQTSTPAILSIPPASESHRQFNGKLKRIAVDLEPEDYELIAQAGAALGYKPHRYGASLNRYARLILLAAHGIQP